MSKNLKSSLPIIVAILCSYLANQIPEVKFTAFTTILIGLTTAIIVFVFIFYSKINAYIQMYFVGKLRGLWGNRNLKELIKKEYENSNLIKIKVTRGHGLFYKEGGVFNECFFKENYKGKKIVKILLHYPCIESEHIKGRAEANQISVKQYIEDLFKVLYKFKNHTLNDDTNEEIFVRFYTSKEDRNWRYYIFKQGSNNKILLFNHYDNNTSGAKSKMLRVKGGNDSLCEELNSEFDKLYNNSTVLIENKKNDYELINDNYCGNPACKALINQSYIKYFKNV